MQVFAGEYNRRGMVPLNIYMPGLVKTKILANEPQPMRTLVKILNWVIGIPVDKAAANVFAVVDQVARTRAQNVTFAWAKPRPPLDLRLQPTDAARLWVLTQDLLRPYRPT